MFSARTRFGIPGVIATAILTTFALAPMASAAPPPLFWQVGSGTGAGQVTLPRGIAANPDNGHVFVAEGDNKRISEFDAWGEFVKAWGWNVSPDGAPGDTPTDQFEICTDACQKGTTGTAGVGQFQGSPSVALDSAGNVYAFDPPARRVQKFSPAGEFLLMFGGGVNQGPNNPGNVCTAAHIAAGDSCGAGTTGSANGQFEAVPLIGNYIAIDPSDNVYVGGIGRIQRFNAQGEHQANIPDPTSLLTGKTVNALAADSAGNLYLAFSGTSSNNNAPDVTKIDAAGVPLTPTFPVTNPRAIAVAPDGDVYIFDKALTKVRRFLADGAEVVEDRLPETDNPSAESTGLAANECGEDRLQIYVSNPVNPSPSSLRAYAGSAPDPVVCGDPPAVPPDITAQYAVSVDTDNALLRAQINPRFWEDTTYYLEYGTGECSSAPGACDQRMPLTDALLGGGVVAEDVTTAGVFLTDLEPGTTYHYRFVTESSGGGPVRGVGGTETTDGQEATFTTYPPPSPHKADCPNQAFRGGASSHLPDCRAYELVSPLDKEGSDISVLVSSLQQSAGDGDAFTYSAGRAFGQPQGAPLIVQYLARRDPGKEEWVNEAISPPREGDPYAEVDDQESHYKAFSADLCSAWNWEDTEPTLAPGALAGLSNLYRRDNCGTGAGGFEALTTLAPPDIERPFVFHPAIQGFSADGSLGVFRAAGQLRGDLAPCSPAENTTNTCPRRLYAAQGGELALLSVLPDGTPSAANYNSAGTRGGLEASHLEGSVHHAVSVDGSKVFWSTGSGGLGSDSLYVRLNPMAASESPPDAEGNCIPDPLLACTVEIAEAENTRFWSAAADGHKAIYSIGVPSGAGAQLYEFDLATRSSSPIAGQVLGVAGTSEDASQVYFASREALTLSTEPNSEGDVAQAGKPNLYHYVAGEGGGADTYAFVATLTEAEVVGEGFENFSPVKTRPNKRNARVSPDGSHIAFTTSAAATGYDNTDLASGEADAEVFLYDAGGEKLVCVSCNPSGARPAGREVRNAAETWFAATLPGWPSQTHPSRALSKDGGRLFFESFDALVLADTNGRKDVYQWEAVSGEGAQGAVECEELGAELHVESSGGCLSLISSGTSPLDSDFLDASSKGRDVFIRTASSLVAQDPGLRDVYDAREGGGLPPPPAPPAACEGEACQGIASPPEDPTPSSSSYQGSGNVTTIRPRCPKGKRAVRKAGKTRCVRKQRRRHAKQRRHRANHDGRATR